MTKRRAPTKKEVGIVLMRQEGKCAKPKCRAKLSWENTEWDHIVPLGLGGENSAENFQALCSDCHSGKTHGTGATTAGSDVGRIAKTKRCAGKKASRFRLPDIGNVEKEMPPAKKGRAIQSAGFRKDITRGMNNQVRPRT